MIRYTVGIDEAGRGPLAGPVAVGVCAVPDGLDMSLFDGIHDSKTLSEKQREKWYETLTTTKGLKWTVSMVGATHIDQRGIVSAVRTALTRGLGHLAFEPASCTVLLDGGLQAPEEYTNQTTIIRGDATEPTISAAAILAKVTRDRYMLEQATKHPLYQFETHKGYGTKAHREAIRTHGTCALHRLSFCSNVLNQRTQAP